MESPLVTVILFAHAPYAKFLSSSLESILRQSYRRLEVLVLTDGSADIRQVVERYRVDGRVSLCAQTRPYFLETANELMMECKGEYLGTWNSDDLYNEKHVELLVQVLESDREAGGGFDNTEYFRESSQDGERSEGLIVPADRAKTLASSRVSVQRIFNENIMTGPSSIVRKSAFERIGGYDNKIRLNCDLHWFYRLGAYFPIRFVNYVGVRKRIHPLNNTAMNPHYEFGVKELEDIRDCYPDVYYRIGKNIFNKKLGRKYFRLGLYYEGLGDLTQAREAYRKAMLLRKLSLRYGWEYCRSTFLSAATKNA
ncbi:MAG TPA: glycosyltransferase family 2 protein [Candidatus Binatia bacterium]|nr:glycosyltransferase family 2 protein [Candidatus Binatia bacterium]